MEEQAKNKGIDFFEALTLIFITLKLTDFIDWNWVWVLAPFWGKFALAGIYFLIMLALKVSDKK